MSPLARPASCSFPLCPNVCIDRPCSCARFCFSHTLRNNHSNCLPVVPEGCVPFTAFVSTSNEDDNDAGDSGSFCGSEEADGDSVRTPPAEHEDAVVINQHPRPAAPAPVFEVPDPIVPCCAQGNCTGEREWDCPWCCRSTCMRCKTVHIRDCGLFYTEKTGPRANFKRGVLALECLECEGAEVNPSLGDVYACSECNRAFCSAHFKEFISVCSAGGDHVPETRRRLSLSVDAQTEATFFDSGIKFQCTTQECADDVRDHTGITFCVNCRQAVCTKHEIDHLPSCKSPVLSNCKKHPDLPVEIAASRREACPCYPKDTVCRRCGCVMCRFHAAGHNRACKMRTFSSGNASQYAYHRDEDGVTCPEGWGCSDPVCFEAIDDSGAYGDCGCCGLFFCLEHSCRHSAVCTKDASVVLRPKPGRTCPALLDGTPCNASYGLDHESVCTSHNLIFCPRHSRSHAEWYHGPREGLDQQWAADRIASVRDQCAGGKCDASFADPSTTVLLCGECRVISCPAHASNDSHTCGDGALHALKCGSATLAGFLCSHAGKSHRATGTNLVCPTDGAANCVPHIDHHL